MHMITVSQLNLGLMCLDVDGLLSFISPFRCSSLKMTLKSLRQWSQGGGDPGSVSSLR